MLPTGWNFAPLNQGLITKPGRDSPQIVQFEFYVPQDAVGSDDAQIPMTLTLDQDNSVNTTAILPLEVERHVVVLQGPNGYHQWLWTAMRCCHVWLLVENVGMPRNYRNALSILGVQALQLWITMEILNGN